MLKEGLVDYVQGEYAVLAGFELDTVGEPPKKKRRKALVTRRKRTTRDSGMAQATEVRREGGALDEVAWREAVLSTTGSCSDGGRDDMVIMSLVGERVIEVPEEPKPKAEELVAGEEDDEVPLARSRGRSKLSAQVVLAGMWRAVSTVDVMVSEVGSEMGKWGSGWCHW